MKIQLNWDETTEEKHARVDEILERNSNPLVCVSCLEIISDRETAVNAGFGYYHGAPYTCVEGREDSDIPWWQK